MLFVVDDVIYGNIIHVLYMKHDVFSLYKVINAKCYFLWYYMFFLLPILYTYVYDIICDVQTVDLNENIIEDIDTFFEKPSINVDNFLFFIILQS